MATNSGRSTPGSGSTGEAVALPTSFLIGYRAFRRLLVLLQEEHGWRRGDRLTTTFMGPIYREVWSHLTAPMGVTVQFKRYGLLRPSQALGLHDYMWDVLDVDYRDAGPTSPYGKSEGYTDDDLRALIARLFPRGVELSKYEDEVFRLSDSKTVAAAPEPPVIGRSTEPTVPRAAPDPEPDAADEEEEEDPAASAEVSELEARPWSTAQRELEAIVAELVDRRLRAAASEYGTESIKVLGSREQIVNAVLPVIIQALPGLVDVGLEAHYVDQAAHAKQLRKNRERAVGLAQTEFERVQAELDRARQVEDGLQSITGIFDASKPRAA